MRNLFFVSVALGIFSGTSISVKAQSSVNFVRLNDAVRSNESPRFIEGIEIKRESSMAVLPLEKSVSRKHHSLLKNSPSIETGTIIESCTSLQFKFAQLMDVQVEAIRNIPLFKFIDSWLGAHYRFGGTTRKGIDCSAFTSLLLSTVFGMNMPRTAKAQYKFCDRIKKAELEEGDLVFFNTRGGISHVGVYLGNNCFVHSSVHQGITISSLDDSYYSRKFIGGGRVNPELTNPDCDE